ncbi:MAG: hypothetical protein ACRC4O_05310 [Giesbergeria sp.]
MAFANFQEFCDLVSRAQAEREQLAKEYAQAISVAADDVMESGKSRRVRSPLPGILDDVIIVPDGQGGATVYGLAST